MSGIGSDGRILPELVETARQVLMGEITPSVAREASTVMLLRDRPHGLEVHLLHRARALVFAGGMHVFPGGAVDPQDAEAGLDPLAVAAVREVWEEVGVLFGEGERTGARDRTSVTCWDTAAVLPWARWITPEVEARRFDTWFWVAAMPSDQDTAGDDAGGEAQDSMWLTPQAALAGLNLMPPTRAMLRSLQPFGTAAEALAAAPGRDLTPVLPKAVSTPDGGIRLVLPDDPDYPA
jgi:8-oxo-dGTP pyrophosphatase MutT (NUDIX family)